MLQLKGSKSARRACPKPQFAASREIGKGCPQVAEDEAHRGSSCLMGNKAFVSFDEAWEACGKNDECAAILQYTDNKFYLRRASDPDTPAGQGSFMFQYSCPEREEELQKMTKEKEEAEHRKLEEDTRRKMHKHRNLAEIYAFKAEHADTFKEQEKLTEKALKHEILGGGLTAEELREEELRLESIEADLHELWSHEKDTDCGWSDTHTDCQWDNQASVNNGTRNATKISRKKAMKVCGEICRDAGMKCGGFSWKATTETCYFRVSTNCGVKKLNGTDCYFKKDHPHPPAPADTQLSEAALVETAEVEERAEPEDETEEHDDEGPTDAQERADTQADEATLIEDGEEEASIEDDSETDETEGDADETNEDETEDDEEEAPTDEQEQAETIDDEASLLELEDGEEADMEDDSERDETHEDADGTNEDETEEYEDEAPTDAQEQEDTEDDEAALLEIEDGEEEEEEEASMEDDSETEEADKDANEEPSDADEQADTAEEGEEEQKEEEGADEDA